MNTAVLQDLDSVSLIPIVGRSAFQRHLHHLGRIGITKVWVHRSPELLLPPSEWEALKRECGRQRAELGGGIPAIEFVDFGTPDPGPQEDMLIVRSAAVFDPRLYEAVTGAGGPVRLVDSSDNDGQDSADIGLSRISGLDLTKAVLRVGDIPAYVPALRRHLTPTWQHLNDEADLRAAADHLMAATQKGVLDFPAKYFHPIPENVLTRMFSGTGITPNHITVATGFIGFAATYLFATGRVGAAIVIAIAVNVLDGVDGKLARVKLLTSRFGDRLDHTLDVAFEYSWYLAIGWGLWRQTGQRWPLETGVGLIAVMLACRATSGIYHLISGRQIHDHTAFDRALRLVAGRRNIYITIYLAGWLAGEFGGAFRLTLGWAIVTLGIYVVRTLMAAAARGDRPES